MRQSLSATRSGLLRIILLTHVSERYLQIRRGAEKAEKNSEGMDSMDSLIFVRRLGELRLVIQAERENAALYKYSEEKAQHRGAVDCLVKK